MLYFINDSIGDLVEKQDALTIQVLTELLNAWSRNMCMIDATRKTYQILIQNDILKGYAIPYKRKQGMIGFYSHISFFIQLAANGDRDEKIIDGAQGRILYLGSYQDVYFFSTNILLCENSHDFMLYKWGIQFYQDKEVKEFSRLQVIRSNGGGSQMYYEESLLSSEKKPTLVIFDSDKKYKNDVEGQTAKEIKNTYKALHSKYLWLHELSVHEIENLIPLDVLVGLKYKQNKRLVAKMGLYRTYNMFSTLFQYFDFKKGFLPSTYRAYKKNLANEEFCELSNLLLLLGVKKETLEDTLRKTWQGKNKDSVIIGGWGDRLLQQSVEYVYSNNKNYTLLPYQDLEWKSLIKDVWSIGCAQARNVI